MGLRVRSRSQPPALHSYSVLNRLFSSRADSPDTNGPAVVLVGHCGFDSPGLTRLVQNLAPNVHVVRCNRAQDLDAYRRPDALWLINRVLDGRFDTASGLELIAQTTSAPDAPAVMLVSNYPDAQAEAESAGALPGFGKSQAHTPQTRERLTDALARLT